MSKQHLIDPSGLCLNELHYLRESGQKTDHFSWASKLGSWVVVCRGCVDENLDGAQWTPNPSKCPTTKQILCVDCPKCGASTATYCTDEYGYLRKRHQSHQERVQAYRQALSKL